MPGISFQKGLLIHQCEDWSDFNDFILKRLNNSPVVWRGQKDSTWLLEPTLARLLRKIGTAGMVAEHLKQFKYATRGRRGPSPRAIPEDNHDEWWALGQHHGLATPLLDWSQSPYVAAFFAYQEEAPPQSGLRAIYGLVEGAITKKSNAIEEEWREAMGQLESEWEQSQLEDPKTIEFIRPLTDENQRLISQNGLFTKSPLDIDIEKWVAKYFPTEKRVPKLYKILLPDTERISALQSLNRMNINFLSLYPDIEGASLHCNMSLEIPRY